MSELAWAGLAACREQRPNSFHSPQPTTQWPTGRSRAYRQPARWGLDARAEKDVVQRGGELSRDRRLGIRRLSRSRCGPLDQRQYEQPSRCSMTLSPMTSSEMIAHRAIDPVRVPV